uniref:Uncharacterized protein n=1 Tax=Oryza punctata TaxID=4537 RepID=A0A0E0KNR3_ORYPU
MEQNVYVNQSKSTGLHHIYPIILAEVVGRELKAAQLLPCCGERKRTHAVHRSAAQAATMADLNNVFSVPHVLTHPGKHHRLSKTIYSVFNIEVDVRHHKDENKKSAFRHYYRIFKRLTSSKKVDKVTIKETTVETEERHLLSLQRVDDKSEGWNRHFCDAKVVAVNIKIDLMLLEVNRENVYYLYQGADNFTICPEYHPIIKLEKSPPVESKNVFLQRWIALRSRTSVWGHINHTNRRYYTITSLNEKGYRMNPIELPEFRCAARTSGIAILNGASRWVRVFHSLQNECKAGYTISYQDAKNFVDSALANLPGDGGGGDDDDDVNEDEDKDDSSYL